MAAPFKALASILGTQQAHVHSAGFGRWACGEEFGVGTGAAMAVFAIHFNGSGNFAIDVPVAMVVLRKVAVYAVHADVKVHGCEVYRFFKLLGIGIEYGLVVGIE